MQPRHTEMENKEGQSEGERSPDKSTRERRFRFLSNDWLAINFNTQTPMPVAMAKLPCISAPINSDWTMPQQGKKEKKNAYHPSHKNVWWNYIAEGGMTGYNHNI